MKPQGKTGAMIAEKVPNQPAPPTAAQIRLIESAEIFHGQNEILIRHEGAIYRMKITRQGKLILNK